jgi:hypothetical protein
VTAKPGTEAGPAPRSSEGMMLGMDQRGMSVISPEMIVRPRVVEFSRCRTANNAGLANPVQTVAYRLRQAGKAG